MSTEWNKHLSDKITRNAMLCITMTMHYLIPCGGKNSFLTWVTWKTKAMTITSRIKLHVSNWALLYIWKEVYMHKELKRGNLLLYFSNILRLPSDRKTTCGEHTMSKCTPQYVEVYTTRCRSVHQSNERSTRHKLWQPTPTPPPPHSLTLFLSMSMLCVHPWSITRHLGHCRCVTRHPARQNSAVTAL